KVQFARFTRKLKRKKWVVYCKGLFHGSKKAYDYLSRYTHRVAISNHRLLSLEDHLVTFRARDNRNPGRHRFVTIHAQESSAGFSCTFFRPGLSKSDTSASWPPAMPKQSLRVHGLLSSTRGPYPVRSMPNPIFPK